MSLRLYNLNNSPYASRVRIQIRHKGLPVDICDPPLPLRSPEFAAAFPLAKLPVLELEDGTHISESTVIIDYLEELYPEPPLRPDTALARAHNGMLIRCADTHIVPALFPVFTEFLAPSGDTALQDKFALLEKEVTKLEALLTSTPGTEALRTGDIALTTVFYFLEYFATVCEREAWLAGHRQVIAWWDWVKSFDAVNETLVELDAAHRGFVRQLRGDL